MLNYFIKLDIYLFKKINIEWANDFFDKILPPIRDSKFWIPFYLILLIIVITKFKRLSINWIIFCLINVLVSDQFGMMIKNLFLRLRPCQNHSIDLNFRLLLPNCPTSFSFVSNHAMNHFALVFYILFTFKLKSNFLKALLFCWALIICYAQVYVGVHYPFDVIIGGIIGSLIGIICSKLFFYSQKIIVF